MPFIALLLGLILGAGGFYFALKDNLLPPGVVSTGVSSPLTAWGGTNQFVDMMMQAKTQQAADPQNPNGPVNLAFAVTDDTATKPNCPQSGHDYEPDSNTASKTVWRGTAAGADPGRSGTYWVVPNKAGHHLVFTSATECSASSN